MKSADRRSRRVQAYDSQQYSSIQGHAQNFYPRRRWALMRPFQSLTTSSIGGPLLGLRVDCIEGCESRSIAFHCGHSSYIYHTYGFNRIAVRNLSPFECGNLLWTLSIQPWGFVYFRSITSKRGVCQAAKRRRAKTNVPGLERSYLTTPIVLRRSFPSVLPYSQPRTLQMERCWYILAALDLGLSVEGSFEIKHIWQLLLLGSSCKEL